MTESRKQSPKTEFVELVEELMASLDTRFSEHDGDSVRRLLTHGEWGLAVDVLCEQLCESEIVLRPTEYALAGRALRMLGMNERYYLGILTVAVDT